MPDSTTRLALPLMLSGQAQKHVTHNEALARLDALVQAVLGGTARNDPPGSPAEGEAWGIGPAPTGAWAGAAGQIAAFQAGAWVLVAPGEGWLVWDVAAGALRVRRGGAWADPVAGADLADLPGIGIGTARDPLNPLSVAAAASLFSHAGAGHQVKINKAGPGDTASLLWQTGFSGRAEIGLAGSDSLALKVSADGGTWTTALSAAPATGKVSLPQGASVAGTLDGTAVMQGATDATAGRLMAVGAFGLGTPPGQVPPIVALSGAVTPGLFSYVYTDAQAPSASSGTLLVQRYSTIYAAQRARPIGSYLSFLRHTSDGGTTWSDWRREFSQATALGAVSQSAGVPTGALIERGSGANGEYARFADGTQICSRTGLSAASAATADGALFRSADVAWTFPASFAVAPAVGGGATSDADTWISLRNATTTGVTARIRSSVTKAAAITFALTAIGRWF